MKIEDLHPLQDNPFKPGDKTIERLAKSVQDFQKMLSIRKIVIDENNSILGGNKKFFALKQLGYTEIKDEWIDKRTNLTKEEKERFIITDNAHFGSEWDYELLENWDTEQLEEWGLDVSEWVEPDYDLDEMGDKEENNFLKITISFEDMQEKENFFSKAENIEYKGKIEEKIKKYIINEL